MGDISSGRTPVRQPAPIYPSALLDDRTPRVEVQARLRVDRAGRLEQVLGMVIDDAAATARWQRYLDAVRAAAIQWRFNPLQVTHWAADLSPATATWWIAQTNHSHGHTCSVSAAGRAGRRLPWAASPRP